MTAFDDRFTFGSPEWLWALLLLAPIIWFFIDAARRREELLSRILAPRLQQSLAGQVSYFKRNLRIACLLGAIALSIVALAKPRYGSLDQEIRAKGRDVIIAIDTSRSMLSTDTAPTRLGRAKLISQDLLTLLRGDRVGLIAFAGTAFLQAPLTLDKGAVLTSIEDLDTNTIPKGGTDIAAAIRLAIEAFGKGETMSRALVLMTDGEELEESGVEAAKEAAAAGIRVFTIGFGSASGSLIPIRTEEGRNDFVRDENGRPVNSKLDAARLNEIAQATGGFYLPYGQDAASIIYQKGILPMDEEENGTLTSRKPIERYGWPAGAALLLMMIWTVLGEGRRRNVVPAAGLALLIALFPGSPGSPQSLRAEPAGINAYQQGDYEAALKDFEKKIQSGANAPEIKFDAGAAAYKAADYKKAADYFAGAMTSANPKVRDAATYNLANSLVRSGEAADGKEAKLSDWKNALQHYETVLKDHPSNVQAKENRDIVKKLIEDLNKKQPPKKQDKKNNNKDQKDKNKDKDNSKNDQSQGGGGQDDNKDQQNQDQNQQKKDQSQGGPSGNDQQKNQDQKNNGQNKPQDSKGSQGGNQDQQNKQNQQQGNQGQATPTPTPDQGKGGGPQNQSGQQQQNGQQNPRQGQGGQPTPTPAQKKEGSGGAGQQGAKQDQQQPAQAAEAQDGEDGKMNQNQARALLRSVQDEEAHQLSNQQNRAVDQPVRDW
jgi:Ca-activated chloride channel family protein